MGAKQLTYSDEARQKLMAGVSKLGGRCGARSGRAPQCRYRQGLGHPPSQGRRHVAEEIELQTLREHGRSARQEAASKTSDVAGRWHHDRHHPREAIYREGSSRFPPARSDGPDPRRAEGRREGRRGAQEARREGRRQGRQGDHRGRYIAANNNPEIGAKLAEAMKLVGASNGVITVEEGKTAETEVVVVQGMQFDRGYLSRHFVTNQDQMICELDNPYILIYEEKIGSRRTLIPLLETISKKKERC